MALSIDFVLDPNTASATLSRTIGRPFGVDEVPDDVVDLTIGSSPYVYTDGVDGTVYGFQITVTDADGKSVKGDVFNFVYKEDTGPGKQNVVQRGYFDFGVYEFLSTAEFGADPEELRNQLLNDGYPLMPLGYVNGSTGWYKCLVDGKVIFIPKSYHIGYGVYSYNMSPTTLKDGGFVSDGAEGALTFDNCPELTIQGRRYRWRGIKHWVGNPPDLNVPLKHSPNKAYERISEVDLYLVLSVPDKLGYDYMLKGFDAQGQTLPPFNAGDSNIFNGRATQTGLTFMGGKNWPAVGEGVGMWSTNTWSNFTSPQYYAKMVPVLELLD